jgi:hypothetical protein
MIGENSLRKIGCICVGWIDDAGGIRATHPAAVTPERAQAVALLCELALTWKEIRDEDTIPLLLNRQRNGMGDQRGFLCLFAPCTRPDDSTVV